MSDEAHSVTRWIERLQKGDPQADRVLWERFLQRMLEVARARLGASSRRAADEEDVVVVAFERFLAGAREGRFPRLNDRQDLWAILFTLTERQALRQIRDQNRLKRGGGDVRGDSALAHVAASDPAPTPEEEMILRDSLEHLLGMLGDDELRTIAQARMQGFSNAEIARQIQRSEVSVERRLRVIRGIWRVRGGGEEIEPG